MKLITIILVASALIFCSCRKRGCTDKLAKNFKSQSNYDDGSCEYEYGCTDTTAINYTSEAVLDDMSCVSFVGWEKWPLIDQNFGPDSMIGFAHLGADTLATREVFVNNEISPTDLPYQSGTLILKRSISIDSAEAEYTGMRKLSAGSSPASNDWEWFILNKSGSIKKGVDGTPLRGPNLLENYCTNCHIMAEADMVFSTP